MRPRLRPLARLMLAAAFACVGNWSSAQLFSQPKVIPTGNWPAAIYTADVNGDGIPDFVYVDQGAAPAASTTHVLLGDGKGGFTQAAQLNTAGATLELADMDGDGHTDIVWVAAVPAGLFYPTDAYLAFVAHGRGDGTFSSPTVLGAISLSRFNPSLSTFRFNYFAAGHFYNKTGPLDFAFEEISQNVLCVINGPILGVSDGCVGLPGGTGPTLLADLNGDGYPDLISQQGTTGAAVRLGGPGFYNVPPIAFTMTGSSGVQSILVQDVNGDGRPDLIVEGAQGRIDYFPGRGDGTFGTTSIGGSAPFDGLTGNGGHLISRDALPLYARLLTATPIGISSDITSVPGGASQRKGIYNAGPGRTSYAVADFNRDGIPDLAVDSPEGIAILFGNADGSFQTSQAFAAGQPAESIALAKFTSSGHLDAVVSTGATQAQLLRGNGDGTFLLASAPTTNVPGLPSLWSHVQAGDFDGDGKLDFAMTADGPAAAIPAGTFGTFVQSGDGSGGFAAPVPLQLPGLNSCNESSFEYGNLAVADFDGDGKSDLLLRAPILLYTFAGTAGQPAPQVRAGVGGPCIATPHSAVAVGDLHNNGQLDAISETTYEDSAADRHLTIFNALPPNGHGFLIVQQEDLSVASPAITSGQMTAPVVPAAFGATSSTLGFPASIGSITTADLDRDGNTDLLVIYANLSADLTSPTAANPNYLYIWYGSGGGAFLTSAKHPVNPVRFVPSRNFYQVSIADINADGIPDLILGDGYLLSYQLGNGDGTFGVENHLLAGQGINGIAVGDLRGTGHNDLVMANGGVVFSNPVANKEVLAINPDVQTGGVTVLLNNATLAAATNTLSAAPEPSAFEAAYTLTAGTSLGAGTVTFSVEGAIVGTGTVVNGSASYTVPAFTLPAGVVPADLLPGTHALTATEPGATIDAGTHVVSRGATTTTLTPTTPSLVFYGQPVDGTINITVINDFYPALGQKATGTFTVYSNGVAVPQCTNLPANNFFCPYGSPQLLDAGTYALTVGFNGDAVNAPSLSVPETYTVLPDITSLGSLSSSANPAVVGTQVTFTAVLAGNYAVPTGTVQFYDGTALLGSGTLVNGIATFATSTLSVGTHPILIAYAGTNDFLPLRSGGLNQVITPAAGLGSTLATLISSLNPSSFGQSVTFTATVSVPASPGAVPSGTLTFMDGSIILSSGPLNAQGIATFTTGTLSIGSHPITARYSGTAVVGGYLPSSASLTQVVVAAASGPFLLTVTPNPISVGVGRTGVLLVGVGAGFAQPVALTCSGLPPETACQFVQQVVPVGGTSTTLQLLTSAPHDCGAQSPYFLGRIGQSAPILLAGLLMLGLRRRRRMLWRALLVLLVSWVGLSSLSGCGQCTDLGTKPGSYAFTVTGTPQGGPVAGPQSVTVNLKMTIPQ